MGDYGVRKLRLGGVDGAWSYIVGNIVEIEQWTFPLRFYICPKCGKVELEVADPEGVLRKRRYVKKCVMCGKDIPLAAEECKFCGASQTEKRE